MDTSDWCHRRDPMADCPPSDCKGAEYTDNCMDRSVCTQEKKKAFEKRLCMTIDAAKLKFDESAPPALKKFFPYDLKVEWVSEAETTDSFFEDNQVVVYVNSYKDEVKQAVGILHNMVIPLAQPKGIADSKGQELQKIRTGKAAAKAEAVLIQVRLQAFLGQTVISSQDERFGIADHDVQPVEQTGVGIIRLVFVDVTLQCRDIAAVAIAPNGASLGKRSLGKFLDGCLLDIRSDHHLEVERTA